MIELFYWPTPNGHKITLFLEEAGLDYTISRVDIGKGDQFKPDFLKIAPNNRMPAIIDHKPADGGAPISIFESGAILWYLAEKTGKFLPTDTRGKVAVSEWLFWQMAGLGPMTGQYGHFATYAPEKIPYAIDRYTRERQRLLGVLDKQLKGPQIHHGRRIHHRRHGVLSVDRSIHQSTARSERLPGRRALARGDRSATGDATRLRARRLQQAVRRNVGRAAQDPVRSGRQSVKTLVKSRTPPQ